jgi:hypothetical protein
MAIAGLLIARWLGAADLRGPEAVEMVAANEAARDAFRQAGHGPAFTSPGDALENLFQHHVPVWESSRNVDA